MAKKEDYLTPEAIADIDEVDRYLSQKGKIDYWIFKESLDNLFVGEK